MDNVGNESDYSTVRSFTVDTTPPNISATNASTTWQNSNISITLSATDNSSLAWSRYSWTSAAHCETSGTSYAHNNTIWQTSNGDHVLYLCAEDSA